MNEQQLRKKVVDTIHAYKGVDTNNCEDIVNTYNNYGLSHGFPRKYQLKMGDESCAATVSVVGIKCDLSDIIYPEVGAWEMYNLYCAKGEVESKNYTPKPGDIIFLKFSSYHTGIVWFVQGDAVHYIAGNDNDRHEACESCIAIGDSRIVAYGTPNYASKATETEAEEEPTTVYSEVYYVAESLSGIIYGCYDDALSAATDGKNIYDMYGTLVYKSQISNSYKPTTTLRLRSLPSIGSTVMFMQPTDIFVADGKTSGKWLHGKCCDKEGWASSTYLVKL